jgi:uncharacterized protein
MTTALPILEMPPRPSLHWAWPDPTHWHRFESIGRTFTFVADGSQVFEVDRESFELLNHPQETGEDALSLLSSLGIPFREHVTAQPLVNPQTRALSLAISQKCNLGCSYCYAQEGSFGGPAKVMSREVAFQAVDHLLSNVVAGDRVHLSFLGGEPLMARKTLHETVQYAEKIADVQRARIGFSITTNGTLITADDAEFFRTHGFAVTVSLDGVGSTHDLLRPHKNGSGTFAHILENVEPLLRGQHPMQVSARVTVTPRNLELPKTLTALISYGFYSVGFSPMLASPSNRDEMDRDSLAHMLEQMISCGRVFEAHIARGERFPFSNMATALAEIHRGTHRPYPCGAGAGYLGVSAEGELAACHRFVGDAEGAMGDLTRGVDPDKQARWLSERHVHRQEPCRSCWARYLCGGGCHHEVIHRGRPACHYIRGWLHYCLEAYARMLDQTPSYFEGIR